MTEYGFYVSHKAWNVHIINISIACETALNSNNHKYKYKTKHIHFFLVFKAFYEKPSYILCVVLLSALIVVRNDGNILNYVKFGITGFDSHVQRAFCPKKKIPFLYVDFIIYITTIRQPYQNFNCECFCHIENMSPVLFPMIHVQCTRSIQVRWPKITFGKQAMFCKLTK